jgi:hypothetical protein
MVTPAPASLRVRAYQVGFGDCILVTVTYPEQLPSGRTEGHLLFDFGSKVRAKGGPSMPKLAAKIAEHCGGHLEVVVATHRHQDHVRGFGDPKAQVHLDPLQPNVVVRPWTDRPVGGRDDLQSADRGFLELLDAVAGHNSAVTEQFALDRHDLAKRARALAELGVGNVQALAMLDVWVPAEHTRWVKADDVVDVSGFLPGVRIDVLGPPTLQQVPKLRSYASGSAEYWLGLAADGKIEPELQATVPDPEFQHAKEIVAAPSGLGRAAWLLDELRDTGARQVLDIVAGFDDVLNNTSVVLLVSIGERTLLFGGDAQIENWSYPLDRVYGANDHKKDEKLRDRLANVDLYKVGHHGSRNATPRRLVELWRTARTPDRPLCSVLSTQDGVYGTLAEGKVPKQELIDALKGLGNLYSTEALKGDVWWFDLEASTSSFEAAFSYDGPVQA